MYRNLEVFTEEVASVVECYQAQNGYTTCMWHNLLNSKIIYDRNGNLAAAKQRGIAACKSFLFRSIIFFFNCSGYGTVNRCFAAAKFPFLSYFWEYEDNCTLKNGIDIDILYRNLEVFTEEVASVVPL